MANHEVTFGMHENDSIYPNNIILRIHQDGHWSSIAVTREAALVISASFDLYKAVLADNDFITPSDEAIKLGMDALDKAEGKPIGTRWDIYLHRKNKAD